MTLLQLHYISRKKSGHNLCNIGKVSRGCRYSAVQRAPFTSPGNEAANIMNGNLKTSREEELIADRDMSGFLTNVKSLFVDIDGLRYKM